MIDINRESNSIRIANILELINDPIKQSFEQNVSLFSNKELFMILEFLESWELNPIWKILDIKMEEYKQLISELKKKKIYANIQIEERFEYEEDKKDLEMLELNY